MMGVMQAADDTRTAKHKLLDLMLTERTGHDLAHLITESREAGRTYRQICWTIRDVTGEQVTEQSLLNWGVL
jgi:hypothetical protein